MAKYRILKVDGWYHAQVKYEWWPWWVGLERLGTGKLNRADAERLCKRHATGVRHDSIEELGYWHPDDPKR